MAVTKRAARGSKLEWHNGTAFVQVLDLEEITVDYGTRDFEPGTDLNTPLSAPQPQVPKLRGPVTITARGWLDSGDTVHQAISNDFKAGTKRQVRLTRANASTATWAEAFISQISEPKSKDGKEEFSFTILAFGTETEA